MERINLKANLLIAPCKKSSTKPVYNYCDIVIKHMNEHLKLLQPLNDNSICAIESAFKVVMCTPNTLKLTYVDNSDKFYVKDAYINDNNDINMFIQPTDSMLISEYITNYNNISIYELSHDSTAYIRIVKTLTNTIILVSRTYVKDYNINEQYIYDMLDVGTDVLSDISTAERFKLFIEELQSSLPYTDETYRNKRLLRSQLVYTCNHDAYKDIIIDEQHSEDKTVIAYGTFMHINIISHNLIPAPYVIEKHSKTYCYTANDITNINEICKVLDNKVACCSQDVTTYINEVFNNNDISKHMLFKTFMQFYVAYAILDKGWRMDYSRHKESLLIIHKMGDIDMDFETIVIPMIEYGSLGDVTARTFHAYKVELDNARAVIDKARDELDTVKVILDEVNDELIDTNTELDDTKVELDNAKVELSNVKVELNTIKDKFNKQREEYEDKLDEQRKMYEQEIAYLKAQLLGINNN